MGPQGSFPVRSRSVRLWRRVRLRDILRRRFFDGDRGVGCGTSRDSSGACCRPFGSGAASQLVAGATFAEPLGQCLDGRPSHDCGREVHLRTTPALRAGACRRPRRGRSNRRLFPALSKAGATSIPAAYGRTIPMRGCCMSCLRARKCMSASGYGHNSGRMPRGVLPPIRHVWMRRRP